MRIVDEWNYKEIKLTLFHMNGRYSLKLEKDILEQWYKFRDGQVQDVNALKSALDEGFFTTAESIFTNMNTNRERLIPGTEQDFEFDIII